MNYPGYVQYPVYYGSQYPGQTQSYPMVQQPQTIPSAAPQMQQAQLQAAPVQALNGKYVDSIESVKATDVMMDGSIMFFPSTDGKTIYTKQLQPDGTSRISTFSLADQGQGSDSQPSVPEIIDGRLKSLKDDFMAGLEDINDRLNDRIDKMERRLTSKTAARSKDE